MDLFRPLLLVIILFFLTVVMCALGSLIAVANPLLFILGIMGGMLGALMVMDFIDTHWLHKW
ncbi:hypothetical protein AM10699_35600 [Acaryochloris marina MBIC10699]|nr:hypothetical protein AM10699_35600 [Acaryochloris marina MBIC10699]